MVQVDWVLSEIFRVLGSYARIPIGTDAVMAKATQRIADLDGYEVAFHKLRRLGQPELAVIPYYTSRPAKSVFIPGRGGDRELRKVLHACQIKKAG